MAAREVDLAHPEVVQEVVPEVVPEVVQEVDLACHPEVDLAHQSPDHDVYTMIPR